MAKDPIHFGLRQARPLFPRRLKTDNKSAGGKSLLIAGSQGMFGAALLAAKAAARVGSGYVTLMTDQKKFRTDRNPDFLVVDWQKKNLVKIRPSSVGIGPGLGQSKRALGLLKQLLKSQIKNVVVDADALNLIAKNKLGPLPKTWLVTPHEGELARLLGLSVKKIRNDRMRAIQLAQKKLACAVLLKGQGTLIANGSNIFEIQSGNSALAKAGTGDVLTGMITGFLAQGLSVMEAACLGAFVHGWMADQWVREKKDPLSLMASDLLEILPKALWKIRRSQKFL